jgi:hypothetical protein
MCSCRRVPQLLSFLSPFVVSRTCTGAVYANIDTKVVLFDCEQMDVGRCIPTKVYRAKMEWCACVRARVRA